MSQIQHVLMTMHGAWTGGYWAGESGQMGVRFTLEDSDAMPGRGTIYTPNAELGDVALETGTASGDHGTLAKQWTCRVGGTGSPYHFGADEQINTAEDAYWLLYALRQYQSSSWAWTHVKFHGFTATPAQQGTSRYAPIVDGSPVGAATYTFTTPIAGAQAVALPPEVAVALSFRAPLSGRRGRGRMYVPAVASTMNDGAGSVASTPTTALLAALQTFVTDVETMNLWTGWKPCICVTSPGRGTVVRPTQVRIGNHFDVQTRRQDGVRETYTAASLS